MDRSPGSGYLSYQKIINFRKICIFQEKLRRSFSPKEKFKKKSKDHKNAIFADKMLLQGLQEKDVERVCVEI